MFGLKYLILFTKIVDEDDLTSCHKQLVNVPRRPSKSPPAFVGINVIVINPELRSC